ncbi:MAG TPA: response regulator [Chloroflexota bacterium]|nr:response regulator [Chloroflexota bacterium]
MVGKRVLIVDDEDDIREVARVSLELIGGFTVLTARSGNEGVTVARSERPDVILLDVMMPDLDGVATFQALQADEATGTIPVIFLTAKLQVSDRRRFSGLGAKSIIAKPFDPLALPVQVKGALGW